MSNPFVQASSPRIVALASDFIVVAKPSGMHTAPNPSASPEGTLLAWVGALHPEVLAVGGHQAGEGGLVHRLDSDTSGLVLFARSQDAFSFFIDAAARGKFIKDYLALLRVSVAGLEGSKPLLQVPGRIDPKKWLSALRRAELEELASLLPGSSIESVFRRFGPGAKRVACAEKTVDGEAPGKKKWTDTPYSTAIIQARTESRLYPCEADAAPENGIIPDFSFGGLDAIMVSLRLTRGFRHQIRAHLAWIGLPLLGDPLYGDDSGGDEGSVGDEAHPNDDASKPWLPQRLCLHAHALGFPDPASGASLKIFDNPVG